MRHYLQLFARIPVDIHLSNQRILFIGEAVTLAHVARPYMLATALDQRGYDIHFAASPHYDKIFLESTNITHWKIQSQTPEQFEAILRSGGILYSESLLSSYVDEDLQLLQQISPDCVIGDLRLSLAISARLLNIPYIAISNAIWSPFAVEKRLPAPSFDVLNKLKLSGFSVAQSYVTKRFNQNLPAIFQAQASGLDRVAINYGLPPFADYLTGFTSGDYTLYADIPTIIPTTSLPTNHRHIGAICWEPNIEVPLWFNDLSPETPLAYVGLGSSGDHSALTAIIEGLQSLDIQIIVATGGKKIATNFSNKTIVTDFLPGSVIARKASLVVTNGGSPSTYQALREGVPVLGVPANMDQLLTMTAVDAASGGIMVRADIVTAKRISNAAKRLLREPKYKKSAQLLAQEFALFNPVDILEETIHSLDSRKKLKVTHD